MRTGIYRWITPIVNEEDSTELDWFYLRFYDDGTVLQVITGGPAEKILNIFNKDNDSLAVGSTKQTELTLSF
jgi:hypothetical protein